MIKLVLFLSSVLLFQTQVMAVDNCPKLEDTYTCGQYYPVFEDYDSQGNHGVLPLPHNYVKNVSGAKTSLSIKESIVDGVKSYSFDGSSFTFKTDGKHSFVDGSESSARCFNSNNLGLNFMGVIGNTLSVRPKYWESAHQVYEIEFVMANNLLYKVEYYQETNATNGGLSASTLTTICTPSKFKLPLRPEIQMTSEQLTQLDSDIKVVKSLVPKLNQVYGGPNCKWISVIEDKTSDDVIVQLVERGQVVNKLLTSNVNQPNPIFSEFLSVAGSRQKPYRHSISTVEDINNSKYNKIEIDSPQNLFENGTCISKDLNELKPSSLIQPFADASGKIPTHLATCTIEPKSIYTKYYENFLSQYRIKFRSDLTAIEFENAITGLYAGRLPVTTVSYNEKGLTFNLAREQYYIGTRANRFTMQSIFLPYQLNLEKGQIMTEFQSSDGSFPVEDSKYSKTNCTLN